MTSTAARRSLPYVVTAVVLSALYLRTLLPSTGNSSDTSKFGYLGVVLGTAHSPGYPLYTMIDALWVRVFPFGEPAWRMNLLSAIFAVATCLVLLRVLRLLGVDAIPAAAGAIAIGLTRAFWSQSLVAEVYSLNALFIAVVLLGVVTYERTRDQAWLIASGAVFILSFAHHTSSVLLLPGLIVYALWRRTTFLLAPRALGLFLLSGLAVIASYGYIAWRTADPSTRYLESRIDDLDSFVATVSGSQFRSDMFAVPLEVVVRDRLPQAQELLNAQIGWLVPLAVYGLVLLARRIPTIAVVTGLWALAELVFALSYRVGDWFALLVPVWLLLALWTAVGVAGFVRLLAPRAPPVRAVLVAVVALGLVVANFDEVDQSGNHSAEAVRAAVEAADDGTVIFVGSYPQWHQFMYVLLGEGVLAERDIFAVKGREYGEELDEQAVIIEDYCAADGERWDLPRLESYVAPQLATDLPMYVYGDAYAADVAANGFPVTPLEAGLYRLQCRF
jgi:hypothetical protein